MILSAIFSKCFGHGGFYTFEHVTRRLCFALNTKRNNILKTLPNNRRKGL